MSKNRKVRRPSSAPSGSPKGSPKGTKKGSLLDGLTGGKSSRQTGRTGKGRAPAGRQAAKQGAHESGRNREIVGVVGLGVAIFLAAALLSLQVGSGTLMGPFGRTIASGIYGLWGMCSYAVVGMLAVISVRLLMDRPPVLRLPELSGLALGLTALGTLVHLAAAEYRVAGHGPGGRMGEHLAEVFRALISTAGTALLASIGLLVAVVIATPLRLREVGEHVGTGWRFVWAGLTRAAVGTARFCGEVVRAVLPERDHDEYLDEDYDEDDEPYDAFAHEGTDPGSLDPPIIEGSRDHAAPVLVAGDDTEKLDDAEVAARLAALGADVDAGATPKKAGGGRKSKKAAQVEETAAADLTARAAPQDSGSGSDGVDAEITAATRAAADESVAAAEGQAGGKAKAAGGTSGQKAANANADADAGAGPLIVESEFRHKKAEELRAQEQKVEAERLEFIPLGGGEYKLPPINLLDYDESQQSPVDRTTMLEMSARLSKTLENYGVKGEVMAIRPGPVVTMYEFAPAPGTRVNKIANLSDDLAMALEALSVRIVAPIPGKAAVGIEVPNKSRETVYLKEIIADEVFQKGKHKLPLAVGKNIEGAPSVVDLAKMPHLLVAGTTGSGKSVAVNSMITSLLYHCTPDDVRLIMVDPKMLELSIYEGIPHLLLPVVTDPKKANLALRWSVEEMERRYDLLARTGVRDLATYNKKAAKLRAQYDAEKLRRAAEQAQRLADDGEDDVEITGEHEPPDLMLDDLPEPPQHLPYIVIIIDEFADLMMCAPKDVETSVARIAQKARAAGIHLILATQRPSVDVITGLIKANFPSRCAFRVTSKVDSRTILDQGGAESLLGAGDMLFSDRGASPCRFHGCFVDEEEIGRVVDVLKGQGRPVYNMEILKPRDEDADGDADGGGGGGEPADEMYDRAVNLVAETRQASISMIQRRLRVGYNRAARMVEQMEREGVVSSPDHTNKREVLVQPAA